MARRQKLTPHQYIERRTDRVRDERFFGDSVVNWLYSDVREHTPTIFHLATSRRISSVLGFLNYDLDLGTSFTGTRAFLRQAGVNLAECVEPIESLDSARKLFERKIRYWECRPMPVDPFTVVSPADARLVSGSLTKTSVLELKGKFFELKELLSQNRPAWIRKFSDGDFAVFRLTPEKYHFNHTPVAGRVVDLYEVTGRYHSCNPSAIVREATPFSKNMRTVTIIDTDVAGGTRVGNVAMIEITALMIGEVVQQYSNFRYDNPQPVAVGMFLEKGCPKSLYRPGSSTDVLLFEAHRILFDDDIILNQRRVDVRSRLAEAFLQPVVETEVEVRSQIARRRED
jgi:phosphatidylserine decarboxylase